MTAGQLAYVAFVAALAFVAWLIAAATYLLVQDVARAIAEVIA